MNDYEVVDYGIFTNAVSTTNTLNQFFDTSKTQMAEFQNILKSGEIFMGPICDSCTGAFTTTSDKVAKSTENFASIEKYLIETAGTYKEGDEASAKVLSLDGTTGGVQASTLESYQADNGEVVYYYQKGYFDEQGNLHEWPTTWGKTLASSGCGPTSMASILATMLGDKSITPPTISDTMKYDENIGGNFVAPTCQKYGLDQSCNVHLTPENVETFLRNNGKIMIAINEGGHYIAVLGINNSTNPPTYIVCDPIDRNTATKTWKWGDITSQHTMSFFIAPPGKTVQQCLPGGTAVQV